MQITKEMLKRIIKEELENVMNEGLGGPTHHGEMVGPSNLGAIIQQQEMERKKLKAPLINNPKGKKLTPDEIQKIEKFEANIKKAKEAAEKTKKEQQKSLNFYRAIAFGAMEELVLVLANAERIDGFRPLEHIDDRVESNWALSMNKGTLEGAKEAQELVQKEVTKLQKAAEEFSANSGKERSVFQKALSFLSGKGYKE